MASGLTRAWGLCDINVLSDLCYVLLHRNRHQAYPHETDSSEKNTGAEIHPEMLFLVTPLLTS